MTDSEAWAKAIERVGASEDPVIRIGDFRFSANGQWTTTFETEVGDWVVQGDARLRDGGLQIERIEISFNQLNPPAPGTIESGGSSPSRPPPEKGIGNEVLSRIPLARIKDSVQRRLISEPEFDRLFDALGPSYATTADRKLANQALAETATSKGFTGRGRPRLGDEHWRRFALDAIRLDAEGRRPLRQELSNLYSRDENTIRDWLHRARSEGWLAPATPGQRGVFPGPKLTNRGGEPG